MDEDDASLMIAALAEPMGLLVFGAIAAATATARVVDNWGGPITGTPYLTIHGLMEDTSMPRDVVERAAERLVRVGLLEARTDEERGYHYWRVNEAALAAASARPHPSGDMLKS